MPTNPEHFFCQTCKSGFDTQDKFTVHNRVIHKLEPLVDERAKAIERGEERDKNVGGKKEDEGAMGGHAVM